MNNTALGELRSFSTDQAGGLMTRAFVAIAPDVRAEHAIAGLRRVFQTAETISYVYVLDQQDHLEGVLPLHELAFSPPARVIQDFMIVDPIAVHAESSAESAARLLRQHRLLALPVVDERGRLLGVITAGAASELLEEAGSNDLLQMAGTDAGVMAQRNPLQIARLRLPWLIGTMLIELGAGLVIHRFDEVLTQVILLASFMPVISAVSGNVGLQAAAIVVRGLDTGHVRADGWRQQIGRELASTLVMATCCGLLLGIVGMAWSDHVSFGLVIGGALTCAMLTAGFMGTTIPMVSKRLGFDPAATAGPFETAFQDVVGFGVFLWLASLMINYLK